MNKRFYIILSKGNRPRANLSINITNLRKLTFRVLSTKKIFFIEDHVNLVTVYHHPIQLIWLSVPSFIQFIHSITMEKKEEAREWGGRG